MITTACVRIALAAGTALGAAALLPAVATAQPANTECIAPAQPGGGFDITCRLAQQALVDGGAMTDPIRISYMPGGIGAVAFNTVVGQRRAEPGTIVAFSSGSLLNLAQGKFGPHDAEAVRWVSSVGTDYGAVLVSADAPWNSLPELMEALRTEPTSVVFGAGGTIGSQDWMKAALTAQAAGVDYRAMRFVAFEGGGDCATALQGGHVQVCMNDVGDSQTAIDGGAPLKILAVYSAERLEGRLGEVPTATEQGYEIEWPVLRGFYVGPDVTDEEYQWWVDAFAEALAAPGYAELLASRNLLPLSITGDEFDTYVDEQTARLRELAVEFGLVAQ